MKTAKWTRHSYLTCLHLYHENHHQIETSILAMQDEAADVNFASCNMAKIKIQSWCYRHKSCI